MLKVTFLGGGSFGTALGVMLSKKGIEVSIWANDRAIVEDINVKRENIKYLPKVAIPSNITAYSDMEKAVKDSNIVVLAVPSHAIREVSKKLSQYISSSQIVATVAKGIEGGTLKRMSEIIEEEINDIPVVVISGPSHAEEVAQDIPTTIVVSSKNMEAASKVQDIFMSNKFRVYTNDDLIGVEIGGACKNIIALAAGISDGIGYGDNTKAALMTRGMSEIIKIGMKLGGRAETFYGLTGMGDLIVTCTSIHSRNRRAGILIGKGMTREEATKEVGMVVEGIKACKAFYELKEREQISMPITDTLYKVLFEDKDPKYGVYELMSRNKKDEHNFMS
ncbi:ketopantoate reductase PanE/ApbA family protein [Clostridium argentinense CDC 2741]|uniref:Glycerol-3-phosphate dehydrogenase [NAD(P)+] n=1 Tax=Clostridium argentinense CDC 2741 TaxID=1418104 RepID=A0A0C1RB78_9CLOT|nr:NAD(P)H-dependent glycerol-3-phosphate dehydrogenase [Clostridium argentinense]ARC84654.1 glycerol-3-phosphate dehydrogenase [Clostridium argentinense]KIE47681.1 ketopantoate reductase PanE/ApbA family protein [Clostridium argentinense CDC 2741]NFF40162.1 NAD(P)H-dependent glycerol-3-phosphate dehydrogenase [Clostridium argentinense]NFP50635.1 NAD(P)H-dependent glycerol-3-phosphate dehydrogenase [Clostridium argentinense]NFP72417.1 NAD(P)H-dependent glycerol-3-phosphate dehydrogenase [Clost